MTARRSYSKDETQRAVDILKALLKTPKTRPGLIAAVEGRVSRNFVYGWISASLRNGTLTALKSTAHKMYQVSRYVFTEASVGSIYPAWLDPRSLPLIVARRIYVDGKPVAPEEKI